MRLSVFTVATPDFTPQQLAAAAKDAGLHGIEWRYQDVPADQVNAAPSFWGNNRCSIPTRWDDTQLQTFRDAAESNGMSSLAVVPYLNCGDLAGTERVLQAAAKLGASFIRLGVHRYDRTRPYPDLLQEQRAYLKQAEALCREYGVKGLIETHHVTITASASAAYRAIEGTDPEWIGVLYDPGNMVHEGFENYRMGMELLGPYLAHVHAKNGVWTKTEDGAGDGPVRWSVRWTGLHKGIVDWAQVIADLKAVGYSGSIGIEDFSEELGTADMLRYFADSLNHLLNRN
ncbi:sugar phosphate isomerase/epimerase [Cohnella pontilimi]|uniref:Sugar phosphate isomerase/epimerase n=1 Tax=Cohnella pontilimi TaxID=2564100 RepID=A0A4U0FHY7_9BACL|nr:sugar phosphate isomerase/epimerase [Cohnella pontilimi]TJY44560.1 sugar phosphate isomerase/epimerase [Cohnella pontilimi]